MIKTNRRAQYVLAFFFIASSVLAHRYHAAISIITRDSVSGDIEIEHRLFMHDLEPLLVELHKSNINFDSKEGEAAIQHYVEQHFAIYDETQKPLALLWVGIELDQTYATVYQEMPAAPPLNRLQFHNQLLSEIPTQVNTLNLKDGLQHTSLVFTNGSNALMWPASK